MLGYTQPSLRDLVLIEPQLAPSKRIPGNLEMSPTQAKKRLEWATNLFILSIIFIVLVGP